MNMQGARARQHLASDAKARRPSDAKASDAQARDAKAHRPSLTSTEDLPAILPERQLPMGTPGLQLDVHKLAHGALMWAQVG